MARGLILNLAGGRIAAAPFPKFFNWSELADAERERLGRLAASGFDVFEKLDGSLGIIFGHGDRWRVATRGRFRERSSPLGRALFVGER
jgi:RNA ligase